MRSPFKSRLQFRSAKDLDETRESTLSSDSVRSAIGGTSQDANMPDSAGLIDLNGRVVAPRLNQVGQEKPNASR